MINKQSLIYIFLPICLISLLIGTSIFSMMESDQKCRQLSPPKMSLFPKAQASRRNPTTHGIEICIKNFNSKILKGYINFDFISPDHALSYGYSIDPESLENRIFPILPLPAQYEARIIIWFETDKGTTNKAYMSNTDYIKSTSGFKPEASKIRPVGRAEFIVGLLNETKIELTNP